MTDTVHAGAHEAEQPSPDAAVKILTVLLTSVAYFMVALDTLVVVTALPSIHRDLGGNVGSLQWTVNAYVLTFGATIITAAALQSRAALRKGERCVKVVGGDERVPAEPGVGAVAAEADGLEHRVARVGHAGPHVLEPRGPGGRGVGTARGVVLRHPVGEQECRHRSAPSLGRPRSGTGSR